jgi:two-component system response regulator HydG
MEQTEMKADKQNTLRILVVDDDENSRSAMAHCIAPLGYDCTLESSPEKALGLYRTKPYDIVITDMQMPGMNGIELLKAIRAFDERARVIIVTAYGDLDTARAAINNRAYGFFGKPINITEFYHTLRAMKREIFREEATKFDKKKLEEALLALQEAYRELIGVIKSI